jgi:hypothetical protein
MPGMNMRVDKPRRDKFSRGIYRSVGSAIECLADMQDPVALINDDPVTDQTMTPAFMADDPAPTN